MKENCWEFKKCGRELNGKNSKEFGICPASTEQKVHGVNDGTNAGRSCWAVSGTFCGGEVQGNFASKLGDCMKCDFYTNVRTEEGSKIVTSKGILARLNQ